MKLDFAHTDVWLNLKSVVPTGWAKRVKDAFSTATSNDVHVYSEQAYETNFFYKKYGERLEFKTKRAQFRIRIK